jgi:hypothetical protein
LLLFAAGGWLLAAGSLLVRIPILKKEIGTITGFDFVVMVVVVIRYQVLRLKDFRQNPKS